MFGIKEKDLGLSKADLNRYSVQKALFAVAEPNSSSARKAAEFEFDLSEQIQKRDGRDTSGIIIPQEVLDHGIRVNRNLPNAGTIMTRQVVFGDSPSSHIQKRAPLTSSQSEAAGVLVDTDLHSVTGVLVENTLALQEVPTYNVLGDPVIFPRKIGSVTAIWGHEAEEGIDFANAEFSSVTAQGPLNSLSSRHFAVINANSNKFLAFEDPTAEDDMILNGLKPGNVVKVYTTTGTLVQTYTITGNYDKSSDRDRIRINSDANTTGLNDGTSYRITRTSESNPTYDSVSFSACHLKCLVPISRTLLLQAQQDPDDLIRFDLAIGNAKALDTALFYGTGVTADANIADQPDGIKGTSGIANKVYGTLESHHQDILDFMAEVGVQNVPLSNTKFLASWRWAHDMKVAQKLNKFSGKTVLEKDGTVEGVPVEVSSQIVGTNTQIAEAFYADYSDSALVVWQDLEIMIDPYTLADRGIVRFISNLIVDFNITRPAAFGRHGGV